MTLPLMAYAALVGLAVAASGVMLERAVAARGWPRRWVWAAMLCANVLLTLAVPWRSQGPSAATSTSAWIASTTGGMLGAGAGRDGVPAGFRWLGRIRWDVDKLERTAAGLDPLVGWAWALGSVSVMVIYAGSLWSLSRRRQNWRETDVRGARVLVSSTDGPAVVGVWTPRIVVPAWTLALDPPAIDLMLRHEREHQRARDPLLLHAAAVGALVMPWNPGVWWMLSRLKLALELDCDARVFGRDAPAIDAGAYGELLLTVAARQSPTQAFVAPAMLEHASTLRRRIAALYPNRTRLSGPRLATAWGTALGLLMVALLLPAPRLRAQPPEFSVVAPLRLSQAARETNAGPPSAAADPVYEIGNGVSAPVPIRQQDPTYPRAAMQAKIAGEVQLSGVVEANGLLDQIRITKSLDTVHGLDQAAIDAANKWIFKPGMKDGKPVPVRVQMVLEFRLRASPPANPAPQQAPPASAQGADDDFAKNAYNDSTPGLVLPKPKSLRPNPAYSQEAMQQKIQGTVKIEAVVAADGTVDRARVVESLDKIYGLDEAAVAAAKRWTFEPGTLNGQPVPVLVSLMMEFRLH